jgi:hypothetical protein
MFGVGWGIFMLVVMLGMGNGLKNAILGGFEGFATNSCFIWTMPTTKPYEGFQRGRMFNFDNDDIGMEQFGRGQTRLAVAFRVDFVTGAGELECN